MARHAGTGWRRSLRHRLDASVRRAAAEASALLFPVSCSGCGEPDLAVCRSCLGALSGPPCRRVVSGVDVFSGAEYAGTVKRVLLAFKREGRTDAARALAVAFRAALDAALAGSGGAGVELVPVPATRRGDRERGYRPVELVLRAAGFRPSRMLRWRRHPMDQIGLTAAIRAANLSGALRARRRLDGRRVIVVDDVVTTGATLAEACRALADSGAAVLACVTVASTPKRHNAPG